MKKATYHNLTKLIWFWGSSVGNGAWYHTLTKLGVLSLGGGGEGAWRSGCSGWWSSIPDEGAAFDRADRARGSAADDDDLPF